MAKKSNKQMVMDPNTPDAVKEFALGKAAAETGEMVVPPQPENNTVAAKAEAFDTVQQQNAGVAPGNQQAVDITGQPGATAGINGTADATPQNTTRNYLGDYSTANVDLFDIAKKANVPVQDVFTDYQRWGRETGNPTDFLPMWFALQKGDISKTPEQIEEDKKKAERKERLERFGNFLSHLGNFVGAVGWGGSVQGLETPQELTKRQQMVRDKTEALRSAYNKSYLENYWKQRAEGLKQQNQDRLEKQYDLMVRKQDWKEKYDAGILDSKKEALRLKEDYNNKIISLREYEDGIKMLNAYTNKQRANIADFNAHKEKVVEKSETTPFGKKTTTTRTSYGGKTQKPQRKKAFR